MNVRELLGDNYKDDMTVEELINELGKVEIEDKSSEVDRLKRALSKSNSEAADYKRQLRDKMSEEEKRKEEEEEERVKLQNAYNALLKESNISKNKAKLISLGYDETLADETAVAMVDGDTDKVFANQKKHIQSFEKKIRADILKDTPKPEGGGGSDTMTLEKFRKLDPTARYEFATNHPEEYKELYGGN